MVRCISLIIVFLVLLIGKNGIAQTDNDTNRIHFPSRTLSLDNAYFQSLPRGTIILYGGLDSQKNWVSTLINKKGTRTRYGIIRVEYYFSRHVSIKVQGAVRQTLTPLMENTNHDSPTSITDVDDFTISTLAAFIMEKRLVPSMGINISTRLPNTNQLKGLGNNSTDIQMTFVTSKHIKNFLLALNAGIGILTPPLKTNTQNDVFLYGALVIWKAHPRFFLLGEVKGRHSSMRIPFVGTEDRSYAKMGIQWSPFIFSFELLALKGLTSIDGDFGIMAGISTQLHL